MESHFHLALEMIVAQDFPFGWLGGLLCATATASGGSSGPALAELRRQERTSPVAFVIRRSTTLLVSLLGSLGLSNWGKV
jgi:hypothetical protein